ncbi:TetR/AcrR family transcriptional regulator [Novosphingobium sp. G106]|uniref:TetR/AcrR family transcriptional regulator n=1 Tax=Novosphingobium sp. G106 TaxID=2849500 RepID=UPI0028114435|nr:TetR/AcrR family transcriptional regulator [Novosphingobium sp. G106]
MDRVPRRPGRPTLSDEQLLDIALDLFLENGFERTSIDAITAAAGMAKRTVYARYGDKETLFKAALARAIEDWMVPVERLRGVETENLEKTLLTIAQMLLTNILEPAGMRLLRLSNAVSVSMPEIAAANTRMGTEPTLAYLADLFRRRLLPEDAPAPEADEAALAFLHLVVGGPASTAAWGVVMEEEAIERHTRYCVRLFLHGALPAPGGGAIERENRRLKALAEEAADLLTLTRDKLREAK